MCAYWTLHEEEKQYFHVDSSLSLFLSLFLALSLSSLFHISGTGSPPAETQLYYHFGKAIIVTILPIKV